MTQETMMDFAINFIKNFKESLGKGNIPVILLLDGHASRWNVESLIYFIENNVYPFILASYTSIWSQPNNNRPNLRMHKCVEAEVIEVSLRYAG